MVVRNIMSIFILLLFYSCSNNHITRDESEYHDLTNLSEGIIDDIFEKVDLVPLQFEKETYPNTCNNIDISDSLILITDVRQLVHIFDWEGHNLSCSNIKYGNGPGEYEILMGAFFGKEMDQVIILSPFKMITYVRYFNTIREVHLPTKIGHTAMLYSYGYDLGKDKYLLLPTLTSEQPERVDIFDSNKETVIRTLNYPHGRTSFISMQNDCFSELPDSTIILCPPAYTKYLYKLTQDSIIPYVNFSFGSEFLTKEEIDATGSDIMNQSNLIFNSSREYPMRQMINSRLIITLVRKNSSSTYDWYTIVSNRTKGSNLKINLSNGKEFIFPSIRMIDENYAYTIYRKEFLIENPTLLLNKKELAEKDLKDIDMEDYVLLKYKFRK